MTCLQTWSKICSRNSALLQASSGESILAGLSSALCLLSSSRSTVSSTAACKNPAHSARMYKSIKVVAKVAARNSVDVSVSLATYKNDAPITVISTQENCRNYPDLPIKIKYANKRSFLENRINKLVSI